MAALGEVGLTGARIVREHDPFGGSRKERTARRYQVIGVDVLAHRPLAMSPA